MSYPMTFQRFLRRNGLVIGDYNNAGSHKINLTIEKPSNLTDVTWRELIVESLWGHATARLQTYEMAFAGCLGDLRRLERDATDEQVLCRHIAERIGVAVDVVAAALKEFVTF